MRSPGFLALLAALAAGAYGCGDPPDAESPNRPKVAQQWLTRAHNSYRAGDADDATQAIDGALKSAPRDPEARLLAARIALAKLDFESTIRLTEQLPGTDAKALRGRAFWYAGDIERAADELEEMLKDPKVKDPWARDVARLARRGHGRHPFAIEGGVVAAIEMPQAGPAIIVPCELEGERILALVATNFGELMIDAASRKEPAWVNLRFGDRLEVKDVPALTHDLSNVSRQLGAPIKALFGVNVLRRMHVTFDRHASQFVVRKNDPPAPPDASRLPIFYARGGAMMMRASVSQKDDGNALLFVDSSAFYPLALDDMILQRSGANLASFRPIQQPGAPQNWKEGMLPYFKLGTVDLPQIPIVQGANLGEYKQTFDVDLGGVVGAGLLSVFRVTFGEEGKWVWLEMDPTMMGSPDQPRRPNQAPPSGNVPTPPPAGSGAPAPGPSTPPGPPPPPSSGSKPGPMGPPQLTPPQVGPPQVGPPQLGPPAPPGAKTDAPKSESKGAAK